MWKDFFYYTRAERQGIIVLIVLIVAVFSVPMFLRMARSSTAVGTEESQQAFEKEYDEFVSSLQKKGGSRSNTNSYRKRPSTPPPVAVALFYFDPNTADSAAFLSLGLSPQVASNILRYRRKQGRFRRPEDFRKIYGLTEEQFQTLLPYIRIAEQPIARDTTNLLTSPPSSREIPKKYPAGTLVSLNEADTTELKKIPGIGSGIARMIVDYRRQLGAFYRIEQLEEIHLNVEKLRPWFTVDTTFISRINLNRASVERMWHHPYINFYQAKVIYEYRTSKRKLKSLQQLSFSEEFTPEDFQRIAPYVCFE